MLTEIATYYLKSNKRRKEIQFRVDGQGHTLRLTDSIVYFYCIYIDKLCVRTKCLKVKGPALPCSDCLGKSFFVV